MPAAWPRQLLAALLLLVLALPLLLVCLIIRLDNAGPVFFVQRRIGRHGVPFRIFKLRTMQQDAAGEARVTRCGAWLRRLGIDEIPQLINVAKGDMALIGPRPLTLEDSRSYLADGSPRFDILPGITGLAQATGRHLPSAHRDRLDRFYVRRRSLRLDLLVFWRTLRNLLREG